MALNSNYISFQSIVESVYRRAGYQTVDWADAIEVIGETIRLIGALPAYKNITTNGSGTNPNPLEITDYRVALPNDFVILEGIRKVNLVEDGDDLKISSFNVMTESTDIFYKSNREVWNESVGTYDYEQLKQLDILTITGESGTATVGGPLEKTITYSSSLTTTASNFVSANLSAYDAIGIDISSDGSSISFKAQESNVDFTNITITNTSGDLDGSVTYKSATEPIQVYSPTYKQPKEYIFQFKIDNGYIYTNFETGYIELSYKGFVTDSHGFPMIPDDERYINAIKWSIIEHLDYKKWRLAEISDKVYAKSEQERLFYIASARSKADIPSPQKMEALKNMFLRSITKTDSYSNYFKYSNISEKRYNR